MAETLEQAVAREVLEEAGVHAGLAARGLEREAGADGGAALLGATCMPSTLSLAG